MRIWRSLSRSVDDSSYNSGMRVPEGLESVLSIDPEIMHGELCFKGTRVPILVFLDNLQEGMGPEEFVSIYTSVKRSQVDAVVAWQKSRLLSESEFSLAS